jgi:enamine deaminase RidA (YjgF/YER057c/UK114 family)
VSDENKENSMSNIDQRLTELGIELPLPRTSSIANLSKSVQVGNLLFISGHGPRNRDGEVVYSGKLGAAVTEEQGYDAARLCALGCLTTARQALGSLDRVRRLVKATGFIASDPSFIKQPHVMNGASDVLVEIFGDRGRGARSAIGVAVIPHDMAMEVEMILEVDA